MPGARSDQMSSVATAPLSIEARELGDSGILLPRIALGCGNFGGIGSAPAFFGQGLSEAQALELMDAAWAAGITHFDTADAYGGGRSERRSDASSTAVGCDRR